MKTIYLAAALLLGVSGCASTQVEVEAQKNSVNDVDALAEFERLSIEMIHEMRLWAKAKEAESRDVLSDEQVRQRFFQSTHVPKGFKAKVTFSYFGPAVKAAEAVAISAGYEFKLRDVEKARGDHVVDIKLTDQPLVEALYEIGLATGDSVEVEVIEPTGDKKGKLIYRYKE